MVHMVVTLKLAAVMVVAMKVLVVVEKALSAEGVGDGGDRLGGDGLGSTIIHDQFPSI